MRAQALAYKMEHENKDVTLDKISGVVSIDNSATLEGRITLDTTVLQKSVDRVPVTMAWAADMKYVRAADGS